MIYLNFIPAKCYLDFSTNGCNKKLCRRVQRRGEEADKVRGRPRGGDGADDVEGGLHSGGQVHRRAQRAVRQGADHHDR